MKLGTLLRAVLCFALILSALSTRSVAADHPQPLTGPFATPVTDAAVDLATFAEWVDGSEHPLSNLNLLKQFLWTQSYAPIGLLAYGASKNAGPRHLRIGFKTPITVGSVLVRGGGQLSVLKPGVPYPGNLTLESQWIPAQRILNEQVSTAEVGADNYAIWVLPPGTQTRALRFTHIAVAADSSYAGVLGGLYVLSGRFTNLAPQATLLASANSAETRLLIDHTYNAGHGWDNGPDFRHPVTAANPEWIVLSWPHPISLSGLAALWSGFNEGDMQIFAGPDNLAILSAPESDWRPVGQPFHLSNQYPSRLATDWLDFGHAVQTRAVRLRMTAVTNESRHPHLTGTTRNGTRIWLDELMAIAPLGSSGLNAVVLPAASAATNAPIPIRFTLPSAGYVSLVIEDAQGNRVRNFVSDTQFPAGENTVWWDGTDDLGRDPAAALHGIYRIPTHFVAPGQYRVRGLYHQAIDLRYEFSVYNPGHPAWETPDTTGGWLTTHSAASSALFLPADKAPGGKPLVYLGCWIVEGGAGLAWVDLDGKKQGGRYWIGGAWTGAQFLARDAGKRANPEFFAYAASTWGDKATVATTHQATIRVTGLTARGDKSVLSYDLNMGASMDSTLAPSDFWQNWKNVIGGFAVHDNVAAISLYLLNKILFIDATTGKALGEMAVDSPRGLSYDVQGNLLVISGRRLLRYGNTAVNGQFQQPGAPQILANSGLDDPSGMTLDATGDIFISDQGNSNQVKVFSPAGKFLHAIGHPGPMRAGPYDPLHMNNPKGITIDSSNHLWVAEEDLQPKRISVWTLDGNLVKSFTGSAEYGGGGSLDPSDKTKFYYHAMEFHLDWKTGADTIADILYRTDQNQIPLPRNGTPESAVYSNGHRYFENTYLGNGIQGVSVAMLFLDNKGIIRPVAAMGRANDWDVLKGDAFKSLWPEKTNLSSRNPADAAMFTWSDTNGNGKVDPEEVSFAKAVTGSFTLMPDLSLAGSYVDGKAMRYPVARFTPAGVPVYDLHRGQVIADGAQLPTSDGGGQVLYSTSNTVLTTAPLPFARDGLGGIDAEGHRWSYPSMWPGLHIGHSAPVPDHRGELEGTTRLLGGFIHPAGEDAGALLGINSNFGEMYLFTADGIYVTQLFQDSRVGKPWSMPQAERNMLMNDVAPHDENFLPSLTQALDGNVYVLDGFRTSIVRVDGLNTIRRLPPFTVEVTSNEIVQAQNLLKQSETSRMEQLGTPPLAVALHSTIPPQWSNPVSVFDSLAKEQWATIDSRTTNVGFSNKPDVDEAAIAIAGDTLFAAFRTTEPNLLRNSGAVANAPFKTGGALDLMIGTDPRANPKREAPVAGDLRLLVYQVNGQTKAMLYRAVVPGTAHPVPFSSPWRTITIDQVTDVSSSVSLTPLTGAAAGSFVVSVPLQVLGLKPVAGERISADVGILRGDGTQTQQRVYWSNKATGITSDVPSEAELTPNLWGQWVFKQEP